MVLKIGRLKLDMIGAKLSLSRWVGRVLWFLGPKLGYFMFFFSIGQALGLGHFSLSLEDQSHNFLEDLIFQRPKVLLFI